MVDEFFALRTFDFDLVGEDLHSESAPRTFHDLGFDIPRVLAGAFGSHLILFFRL